MSLVVTRFLMCMHKYEATTKRHLHCLDRPTHLLNILGLVIESLLFGLFTSCMVCDQWDVVISNMTHIDRLKGDSATHLVPGVIEVFGASLKGGRSTAFRWDWLSPFHKPIFPPGRRDEILGYCRPCPKPLEKDDDVESGGRVIRSITEIV